MIFVDLIWILNPLVSVGDSKSDAFGWKQTLLSSRRAVNIFAAKHDRQSLNFHRQCTKSLSPPQRFNVN
jgi:hypothetical protein